MGKRKEALVPIKAPQVPAYLKTDAPKGVEKLSKYVRPPWVRIVQGSSGSELKDQFGIGDCVITPSGEMLSAMERDENGNPTGENPGFDFTPLAFYAEFVQWNKFGEQNKILQRTLDENSELAHKARTYELRTEVVDDKEVSNVEHLNFFVAIHDRGEIQPAIMSFSKMGHKFGGKLSGLIKQRRVDIFGCRFHADIKIQHKKDKDWWGIECRNPDKAPWVSPEDLPKFAELHEEFVKLIASQQVQASYDEPTVTGDVSDDCAF